MAVTIIRDGQVVHTDTKQNVEEILAQQQQMIQDLQNQIKDLKSKKQKIK
jgi:hypothetical protein